MLEARVLSTDLVTVFFLAVRDHYEVVRQYIDAVPGASPRHTHRSQEQAILIIIRCSE